MTTPICSVCQQLPLKRARYLDALLSCEQALMQADGELGFLQHLGQRLDADYRSLDVESSADRWRDQLVDIGPRVTRALETLVDGELPIDRLCDPTPALYQHVVAGMHHFDYLRERETSACHAGMGQAAPAPDGVARARTGALAPPDARQCRRKSPRHMTRMTKRCGDERWSAHTGAATCRVRARRCSDMPAHGRTRIQRLPGLGGDTAREEDHCNQQ
jgi:hypothetical protein